jgi:predicted glycogen debranching enzyme
LTIDLLHERNIAVLRCERVPTQSLDLAPHERVRLIVRFDLEDRSFHGETHASEQLVAHFQEATTRLEDRVGFRFTPAADRSLTVTSDRGSYLADVQWTRAIFHASDAERGLGAIGDAYSPGWFSLPLAQAAPVTLVCSADREEPSPVLVERALSARRGASVASDAFEAQLRQAAESFIVRRGAGRTVIAGYPWFLDWGRDTFIAARGLIAAGYHEEVRHMLATYAALEQNGTLPNYLAGEGEGSRETSDAPLWFALACAELASVVGSGLYELPVGGGRSLRDVLVSIATNLLRGAQNGVRMDMSSGLIWSPSHFTWMDTNYPPGTPREGYPIELSVLWLSCTRELERLGAQLSGCDVAELSLLTERSLQRFYRPELGYCADTLHAAAGTPASAAEPDDHLRPNQLLAVAMGVFRGQRARSIVAAAERYLLVPGAMRTLAPKPVSFPLPIRGAREVALNHPTKPYFGRYEGDEDTRRKPAYHNGTAWVWWLPIYCEALVAAWDGDSAAVAAARAVLGSTARLLSVGCIGQLPEIVDGDGPHTQRGCDAQAWSATETLRVWLKLGSPIVTR